MPPKDPESSQLASHNRPSKNSLKWDGREWPLYLEPAGWRLKCRAKGREADHRTGTTRLDLAKQRAKEWLEKRAADPAVSRRGGGTLEALVALYLETPKRTMDKVASHNVSRLRGICRLALGKELAAVTCREVGPPFWERYQRARLKELGHEFDLSTRRQENIRVNAAVRAARAIFIKSLIATYRASGLDVQPSAGDSVSLPVPYVPPVSVDDGQLIECWQSLEKGSAMWLVVGLARFAGLRRNEISGARGSWIQRDGDAVRIVIRDRPEEEWWHKTGVRPYSSQVIDPELAEWLHGFYGPGQIVAIPSGKSRPKWFEREPVRYLKGVGVRAAKPLHRLRGLYADALSQLTADAVAAQIAGVKAAQEALGHADEKTTRDHYLSPES